METESRYPFRNPDLPLEERVNDLVGRLTREEKIELMCQYQAEIPRLGIAPYKHGTEAAHGVAWLGEATVFPQPIGLACTWDKTLLEQVGEVIGTEARGFFRRNPALHGLTLWAPTVDLERDPRWGRTEEAYGEDPHLAGRLASALIRGIQGNHPFYVRAVASLKHFLANNNEAGRGELSVSLTPRNLHEYYLRPFEICFKEGGALSMMTAYNGVNGLPCNIHPLVRETVKEQWGMNGFVVSDAWDVSGTVRDHHHFDTYKEAVAASIKAGIDSLTDDADLMKASIREALEEGLLEEHDLDTALRNTFRVRFRLGEFDPEERNPYALIDESAILRPEHARLSLEAARKNVVLLKNDRQLLPLAADRTDKVAVIGPLADAVYRDWYSGTLPYAVTPLAGILEKMPGRVLYADGDDRIRLFSAKAGRYVKASGEDRVLAAEASDGNEADRFRLTDWGYGNFTLLDETNGKYVTTDDSRVMASADDIWGWFVKEVFRIGRMSDGTGTRMTLNTWKGDPVATGESGLLSVASGDGRRIANEINVAGAAALGGGAEAHPSEAFIAETALDGMEEAVRIAKEADAAVVFVGNHPLIGGKETQDREGLALAESQENLIKAVHAANPNTVVVIVGSYPFAPDWVQEHVPAILYTSHAGQEMGRAIADVLFGDYNPGGRLNMTWYRSDERLPDLMDYDIIKGNRTYQYFEGTPLYPFGHGLSYSRFRYGSLSVSGGPLSEGGSVTVEAEVTNVSDLAGEEVAQLYGRVTGSRVKRPLRQLLGFERIRLAPGETKKVRFVLQANDLRIWDTTRNRYCLENGECQLMVGASSADIRLTGTVPVLGETIPPRNLRQPVTADQFDDYHSVAIGACSEGGQSISPLSSQVGRPPEGWIRFDDAVTGEQVSLCEVRIASRLGGTVEIRAGGPDGSLIGRLAVDGTSGTGWRTLTCAVTPVPGPTSICLLMQGDVAMSRFRFS